jgi:hypothetical protein
MIQVNSQCPVRLQDVSEFGLKMYSHWLPATAYYFEAAKAYNVNALILVAWAIIRSEKFSSKAYNDNQDIYALGGRYKNYRDSIMCGASELAKFDTTEMLTEQEAVEAIYENVVKFAAGLPPPVEPPPPPKPTEPQKPVPVPTPSEPVPSTPSEPWNWKKIAAWVAGICTAAGVITMWTPTPLDDIIVKAIKVIADLLSNM